MSSTNRQGKIDLYKDNSNDTNFEERNNEDILITSSKKLPRKDEEDLKGAIINKKYVDNICNINLTFNAQSNGKDDKISQKKKSKSSINKSKQNNIDRKSSKNIVKNSAMDQSNFFETHNVTDTKTNDLIKTNETPSYEHDS